MNSSLPITAGPTLGQIQALTVRPTGGAVETRDNASFDERWDAWVVKGRRADAALTERVRMLAMLGVMAGLAAGTVWIFLG